MECRGRWEDDVKGWSAVAGGRGVSRGGVPWWVGGWGQGMECRGRGEGDVKGWSAVAGGRVTSRGGVPWQVGG